MASGFSVGDLVWAKMKGFSPWPARVVEPTKDVKRPSMKKAMHCVFFFGSDNYAWVLEELLKPYEEFKDQNMKHNKSGPFKEAMEAIEDYIKNQPKQPVKSSDLPSIDEELATIFPYDGSNQRSPRRDYSRTPVQNKSKSGLPQPLSQPKEQKPPVEKVTKPEKKKNGKAKAKDDNFYGITPKPTVKRASSDSSSTSSLSTKRVRQEKPAAPVTNSVGTATTSVNSVAATSPTAQNYNSSPTKTSSLLMRPSYVARPVTPPLDVEKVSDVLKQKNVKASSMKFGFLGLGIMGQGIVKNLLNSGHQITVWNRTPSKCRDFVKAGAMKAQTPADVVAASDITFCCVSDPLAAKEMVFGNCGVLQEIGRNKGYVEMTSIDPETSQDVSESIIARGGRYLEAPVSGSKKPAEEGMLIILAAGDRSLFNDCTTCFQAMGKHAFYLGDVGNGSKMNLILNMLLGTTMASLAEAMALADRAGLSQRDLVEILELGSLSCPAIVEKGHVILEGTFTTNMPLQHMQKDLRLALSIGDQLEQPLPLAAAASEVFKHAKRMGYSEHDVSAVYIRARF